jgi:hypothetical protein
MVSSAVPTLIWGNVPDRLERRLAGKPPEQAGHAAMQMVQCAEEVGPKVNV